MTSGRARALWLSAALLAAGPARGAQDAAATAFEEFPVGAGPAAMGGAYTALADDAYGLTHNPGGLGAVKVGQAALQHAEQVEGLYFEHASLAVPFHRVHAVGAMIQYFGAPDLERTDAFGFADGRYKSYYGVFGLSYGRRLSGGLSVGATGKIIRGQLDDVRATAYAGDAGVLYRASERLSVGAAAIDVGSGLRFLDRTSPLPATYKVGAAFRPLAGWTLALDGDYRPRGPEEVRGGVEWRPMAFFALRAGYHADARGDSADGAGFSAGAGFFLRQQEFSYAWVPLGRLGSTSYFSFLWRFGEPADDEEDVGFPLHR